jgi:hypothetical protein
LLKAISSGVKPFSYPASRKSPQKHRLSAV